MNAVTNFILLAILTLVASRHVHAYRIARRRRTGDRTNRRAPITDSLHIPLCDPTCCNPSICLKYLIQPQKPFMTDARQDQVKAPVAPEQSEYLFPFDEWTTAVRPYSLSDAYPSHPRHYFPPLTKEEQFIVRTLHGRYFLPRDQLPPLRNEKRSYEMAGGPAFAGARSKRTSEEPLCPSYEQWSDIQIAYSSSGHTPVQVAQLDDDKQWFLEERCQTTESPIVSNVQCRQRKRQVRAIIVRRGGENLNPYVEEFIDVQCCVAVRSV
ncbi:uncharacterized protein [Diadema setosum]|uniref:uncharacterized protein n=1 Tax=Diadema setosum TaxID=31175 RepID=UPI003B3BE922